MKILLYAGLDVHKETIDVVVYRENKRQVICSGWFRIGKIRDGRYSGCYWEKGRWYRVTNGCIGYKPTANC
jgi:hypothetical protein